MRVEGLRFRVYLDKVAGEGGLVKQEIDDGMRVLRRHHLV